MDQHQPTGWLRNSSTLTRLPSFFGAVTSALQPSRMPIALLAALVIGAIVPIVDLAAGVRFGDRGFSGSPVSESQQELSYQRARNEAARVAALEISRLENEGRDEEGGVPRLGLGALRGAVRDATRARIDERRASEAGLGEAEERDIRRRAAAAMDVIDAAEHRGVASVFIDAERAAAKQVLNGIVQLDPEMFLAGVLGAIFTVPAAAIRASPLIFPLGLLVLVTALTFLAGALARMAAVHAGRNARLGPHEAAWYARARALNLVALPVLPTLVIAGMALVVLLFALLLRVPFLNLIAAILFAVPVLVALLGAILALVGILAFPLMPAAVAVEDCDAGDAITRAYALVLARPLVWLSALACAILVLVVGGLVVGGAIGFARGAIDLALEALGGEAGRALAAGETGAVAALFGPERLVAGVTDAWLRLLGYLPAAYLFSLACDLSVRGYLLMRARIDGEHPSTISGYGIR